MSYSAHIKRIIPLAMPIIIGYLGIMSMGIVDNIMIGHLGATWLAAASLGNALFSLLMILGLGATFALSPLIAAAFSSGDKDECSALLHNGLWLFSLTAIVIMFMLWGLELLIPRMGQEEEVARLSASYLHIVSWSMLPLMLFQTYRQFTDGLSRTRPAMYMLLLANGVNILFNWVLIYGHWGFPALELDGAALSTLITRVFLALSLFIFVGLRKEFRDFKPTRIRLKWHRRLIVKLLSLGIPSGFQAFFEIAAFSAMAVIIGWLGAEALAAHQIALSLASLTFMLVLGISSAASIRVGAEFGRPGHGDIRVAGFSSVMLGAIIMAVNGLLFIIFRAELVTLFIDDPAVQRIAEQLLIIAAAFQIFDGIQAVAVGILRGIQDVKVPTMITFVAYWIINIPLGYLFGFTLDLGVEGVWYAFVLGLGSAAFMLLGRFSHKSRLLTRFNQNDG